MDLISEVLKGDKESFNKSFTPEVSENNTFHEVIEPVETRNEEPETRNEEPNFIDEEPTAQVYDGETGSETGTNYTDLTQDEIKRNELTAQLYVILVDTGAGLVFQLTAGDFSEESERKFSLSKTKQKELAKAWAEVLNIEQKKTDPKTQFYKLLGALYLPLLISAISSRVKKKKAEKIIKQREFLNRQSENLRPIKKEEKKQEEKPNFVNDFFTEKEERETEDEEPEKEGVKTEGATATLFSEIEVKEEEKTEIKVKNKRGRKKGTKKNPNTGKYEKYYKTENGFYVWKWGETQKIK